MFFLLLAFSRSSKCSICSKFATLYVEARDNKKDTEKALNSFCSNFTNEEEANICADLFNRKYLLSLALINDTNDNVCTDFGYCSKIVNSFTHIKQQKIMQILSAAWNFFYPFVNLLLFIAYNAVLYIPRLFILLFKALVGIAYNLPTFPVFIYKSIVKRCGEYHALFTSNDFVGSFISFSKKFGFVYIINLVLGIILFRAILLRKSTRKNAPAFFILFVPISVILVYLASTDFNIIPDFIYSFFGFFFGDSF